MKPRPHLLAVCLFGLATLAPAGQGPAGASGPCSHVIGPIDVNGAPVGFTCEDVGGSALLVWNAAQLSSDVTINCRCKAVNFYPGDFSVDGVFKSSGPLAFIGGGITVNGSITGSSVLIVGANSSEAEIKGNILGSPGRLNTNQTSDVIVESGATITATNGSVVIAGNLIVNGGTISARKTTAPEGDVILTAGTTLKVGWNNIIWVDGTNLGRGDDSYIRNTGTITADNVMLEAHLTPNIENSITNRAIIDAKHTVTFVTGSPGLIDADGKYSPGTFGASNVGTIYAAEVTIKPYYVPGTGSPDDGRTFKTSTVAAREALQTDIGGIVLEPNQDNPLPTQTSAVIDNTGALTPTSSLVIPQLAASMSHLNATQQPKVNTLAVTSTNEPLRGDGKPAATKSSKPRPKAKPVLVRGAFFGSKISATITSR